MVALSIQIILTIVSFLASCLALMAAREVVHTSNNLKEDIERLETKRVEYTREINLLRTEHYELSNKVKDLLKKS